jgi:hypothetical protein
MAGTSNETDMYKLLSQVFTPEVANTLLQQLKGDTKPAPIVDRVMPGDLITAELMNQVLLGLQDLQVRIDLLEKGSGVAAGHVIIFRPLPDEQFKSEQDITIEGKNFGISDGSCIIKINDTTVTVYRPGASNERLTINIPPMDVSPGGDLALLTVANSTSSAERQIYLLPAHELAGHVDLSWIDAEPLTPVTGEAITFKFTAKSRANLDASYLITPVVSRVSNAAEWNAQLDLLDKDKKLITSKKIPVIAGGETIFFVRLKSIPAVSGNATPAFVLSVGISAGAINDGTGPLVMKVGTPVELPDPSVSLAFDSVEFMPNVDDGSISHDIEEDTISLKPNCACNLTMAAEIKQAGTYVVTAEIISGAANWTVRAHPQDPANYPVTDANLNNVNKMTRVLPRFQFLSGPTPGDSGEVRLKIFRDGANISRSVLMLTKKG